MTKVPQARPTPTLSDQGIGEKRVHCPTLLGVRGGKGNRTPESHVMPVL